MARVVRVLVVVVLLVAAVTAAGWPVYVAPQHDRPRPADAILVLGGAHDGREEFGLDLARQGYAPRVLLSNPYGPHSKLMNRLCNAQYSFEVTCFDPSPRTTRGEARYLEAQARAHGWNRVIVVTFAPHISRARYIIERCFPGELMMVENPTRHNAFYWTYMYLYQTVGYVKAVLQTGC
ncbi:YdcF family protein [Rhodococcus sp. D2-41]|uniref:YdcF family protein n=1 Tax=Speluncibacter jeojiensis TaxID=2710754 RepID=UPI0024105B47|nr:YdcF family protein [Rhodococcus sp. D2-41]MDG3010221.1 YdcF family protein [Rhodococcus sp. D2-41]